MLGGVIYFKIKNPQNWDELLRRKRLLSCRILNKKYCSQFYILTGFFAIFSLDKAQHPPVWWISAPTLTVRCWGSSFESFLSKCATLTLECSIHEFSP